MPVADEFVKKREEITIKKVALKELKCRNCGATVKPEHIKQGFAKCEYCGTVFSIDIDLDI